MDADCLIKLTKSKLKEAVCNNFTVVIPQLVKQEVIDNAADHPDSIVIRQNIDKKLLKLDTQSLTVAAKGEYAVYEIYRRGKFDAICSDDKKFIKRLRLFDVPYITPAVFIVLLLNGDCITLTEAFDALERLSLFVSDDEYSTVRIVLEERRPK